MLTNEIKQGGVYKAILNVEFRPGDIQEVELLVRVLDIKYGKGIVEINILNDSNHVCYWLNVSQIEPVT